MTHIKAELVNTDCTPDRPQKIVLKDPPYLPEKYREIQEVKVMIKLLVVTGTLITIGLAAPPTQAADVLTGDKKLACEAILCLSSGDRPSECSPALSRYFGIMKDWWKDTVKARRKFLNKCPDADQDKEMKNRIKNISKNARQWKTEGSIDE